MELRQAAQAAADIGHCEENAKTERSPSWLWEVRLSERKARIVPAAGRGVDVRMPSVQVRALATVRGASLVEEAEIKRLRASGGCLGTERR